MNETINQRIFHYRKLSGLTQEDVANKMNMKPSTYSQMERKGKINTDVLIKIADILDVPSAVLLNGDRNMHYNLPIETVNDQSLNKLNQPPVSFFSAPSEKEEYIPSKRELAAIKTVHYLPKKAQEEIYLYIEQKYRESK